MWMTWPKYLPTSRKAVYDAGIEAGRIVKDIVSNLDLILSDKSKIMGSSKIVEFVANQLNKEGIQIQYTKVGDDLGIGTIANGKRDTKTLNNRNNKGSKRAKGINALAKQNRKATKLTKPGIKSMQSYGHQAMGAAPTQMHKMKKN